MCVCVCVCVFMCVCVHTQLVNLFNRIFCVPIDTLPPSKDSVFVFYNYDPPNLSAISLFPMIANIPTLNVGVALPHLLLPGGIQLSTTLSSLLMISHDTPKPS